MNKLLTKIVGAVLGASMAVGVGVGVAINNDRKELNSEVAAAGSSDWEQVTSLSGIESGKKYIIVSSTDAYYLNGSTSSSHFSGTTLSNSAPASSSAAGVLLFTAITGKTDTYSMQLVSTSKYIGATAAKSGSATNTLNSDSDGWKFTGSSGDFNAQFQASGKQAYLRTYTNNTQFRTYANTSNGTVLHLYKEKSSTPTPTVTGVAKKTAPTKTQYVSGESFNPAGLVVTVSYSSGDPEDVAYTGNESDFDWSPKTITAAGNVEIQYKTYSTMKVTQAVTLVTVTNVTGVASHPSEVPVDGTIDPDDVTLNVTYSNSTSGTVKATSVTCDTSVAATGVTATATYSEATGIKTATFTIDVVLVPGYDLVTSASSLHNGATIVIYSFGKQKILGNSAASSLRTGLSLTVAQADAGFIATEDIPANTEILTLVQSGSHWELKTSGNKYLSLTSDANAQNISDNPDTANNTTEWDISFSENDVLIQSVAYSARYLECNSSSGNFGCYKGTQTKVQLYLLRNTDPYFSINMTNMYLTPLGTQTLSLTAHNQASDTVSWSTGNASVASIPANSTGMSVVVTGVAEGNTTITATFGHPLQYAALVCSVEVLDAEPYVNVKVTTFTKTTSKPTGGWAGTYLIGESTTKTILNGSLSPLPGAGTNFASLESLPNSVPATSDIISKSFTIKATETEGKYTIRSNSYYYIGNTSTTENNMDTSVKEAYEVSISDAGVVSMNSRTLAFNNGSGKTYRFFEKLNDSIKAAALWKADGEMREITSTLADWYNTVKEEEYLVCNDSGTGSKINWSKLEETAIEDLTSADLDTLENMTAKSSENGGNYLEDLISDYDYLVAVKHYDDFLGREDAGTLSVPKGSTVSLVANSNTNIGTVVVIVSLISLTSVGGYFLLRKRKEQ